jgi:3-oxoacyl-[acyl-carrier protein] reductase
MPKMTNKSNTVKNSPEKNSAKDAGATAGAVAEALAEKMTKKMNRPPSPSSAQQQPLNLDLTGKTALVCGGSSGIGAAAAQALALQGARVVVLARDPVKLKSVVQTLPGRGHHFISCDVTHHEELRRQIQVEVGNSGGAIEILVLNSGGPPGGLMLDATPEALLSAFAQHLVANQIISQLVVPGMKDRGFGRIINVISTSVRQPIANLGVSNTVRGAVAAWSKTLANELAQFGVTVNSVLPGYTNTPRLHQLMRATAEKSAISVAQVQKNWELATPMHRLGEPEEIASAVVFLASPAASFITGVALPVDGGRISAI